ncbi:MAG: excinuclease ABC subunit UvrC [Patescibacteria group bacterium]|jgi:excinuclease ABC subunit C
MKIPTHIKPQIEALPKTAGVYFFKGELGEIMYVGKANSLRDRVKSYWAKELNRSTLIYKMVEQVVTIDFELCDSGMEALIAEANYIKRLLPKYNTRLKDDKSYYYVKLDSSDGSDFPKLLLIRKNQILDDEKKVRYFGPYTSAKNLRLALKMIRRIFPYRSCNIMPQKPCLQYHIKRCSAPCAGNIDQKEYAKTISRIVMMLEGNTQTLIKQLKKEMDQLAKKQLFEQASVVRNQYLALQHLRQSAKILDVDDIRVEDNVEGVPGRLEGFDVSNLSGKEAVVSMVVFTSGKPDKKRYKKFKIRGVFQPDDYAMLQETITRRLIRANVRPDGAEELVNAVTNDFSADNEWSLPDIFIIDGGKGQVSAVKAVLDQFNVEIPIIGIAKGPDRKGEDLYFSTQTDFKDIKIIRSIRDEAHRFAIAYHRLLHQKSIIKSELDDVPGIGKITKTKLLKHFGSVAKIRQASELEIASVVGPKLTKAIIKHLI